MGATYDPANYAQNSQEELEQCMLLTGNKFQIDNINAFPHLQAATIDTSAYFHIDPYEEIKNTHSCMENLKSHFLSDSYNTKMMAILDRNVPRGLEFRAV